MSNQVFHFRRGSIRVSKELLLGLEGPSFWMFLALEKGLINVSGLSGCRMESGSPMFATGFAALGVWL